MILGVSLYLVVDGAMLRVARMIEVTRARYYSELREQRWPPVPVPERMGVVFRYPLGMSIPGS